MNYYWVYPWPIEVANDASAWTWLGPVLTFLGSVLLFVGSLIVLRRTNEAADRRAAADRQNERERDFRLFQRDTLLRIGDEVVDASIDIWDLFVKLRNSFDPLPQGCFEGTAAWARKIAGNAVRLSLIGAHEPSARCITLRDLVDSRELQAIILELDTVDRTTVSAQLYGRESQRLARQAELQAEYEQFMERINDARQAFSDSVERDLARTNQPTG